jgi:hypothetical protein
MDKAHVNHVCGCTEVSLKRFCEMIGSKQT